MSLRGNNSGRPGLCSAEHGDLFVPQTRTTRLGRRSFFIAAPVVWNSLPLHLRSPSISLIQFPAGLKTHHFQAAAFHRLFLWELLKRLNWDHVQKLAVYRSLHQLCMTFTIFPLIFSCCIVTLMFDKMFIASLACCVDRHCWNDWRRIRKRRRTRKPSSLTWVKLHSCFVDSYTGSEPAVQKIAGIDQVIYNLWHVMNNRKQPLWQNCIFPTICIHQVSLKLFNKYWIVQKRSIFECRGIWIQTLSHP